MADTKKPDIFASLQKTLRDASRANRPLNHPVNIVGQVVEYGKKTIKVEVQNGQLKGQTIDVIPGRTPISEFKNESDETTSSYTKVGGYIRFDKVSRVEGEEHYKANWANRFAKEAENSKGDFLMADVLTRVFRAGSLQTRSGAKIPRYRMNILDADNAEVITTREALTQKLTDGFSSHGGVLLLAKVDGAVREMQVNLPFGQNAQGEYIRNDAGEFAAELVDGMDETLIAPLEAGDLCVAPMRSVMLGKKVCEGIAETLKKAGDGPARFMTVNLNAYEREPIGLRLSYALGKNNDGDFREGINQELVDRMKAEFLETARPEERDALAKDGWRGVSDTALTEFFAAKGVEIRQPDAMAWNVSSVLARPYKDNPDDFLILKSHEAARSAKPFPQQIEFLKDARAEHFDEMRLAVISAVGGPVKKVEQAAPAADADAPAKEAPAAKSYDEDLDNEGEENSIDELLGELPDDAMELG